MDYMGKVRWVQRLNEGRRDWMKVGWMGDTQATALRGDSLWWKYTVACCICVNEPVESSMMSLEGNSWYSQLQFAWLLILMCKLQLTLHLQWYCFTQAPSQIVWSSSTVCITTNFNNSSYGTDVVLYHVLLVTSITPGTAHLVLEHLWNVHV